MQVLPLGRLGRLVAIGYGPDEGLLEGVRRMLQEQNISNAVLISGIGTLKKARYHRVTTLDANPVNEFLEIEAPIEISSISGLVINGEPHLHMTFSDMTDTYAVHLEEGSVVLYLAELMFAVVEDANWQRSEDAYGVRLLGGRSDV